MPLLSVESLEALSTMEVRRCETCRQAVRMNYCRECDVYFEAGHAGSGVDDERCNHEHDSHRTY